MHLTGFLMLFTFLLFLGTLCCCGWFVVTRGRWVMQPDGRLVAEGKLCCRWHLFWTRQRRQKRLIQYKRFPLMQLLLECKEDLISCGISVGEFRSEPEGDGAVCVTVNERQDAIQFSNILTVSEQSLQYVAQTRQLLFKQVGEGTYHVYQQTDNYVFPRWVRDPLTSCVTCFGSVYGSLVYWGVLLTVREDIFGFSLYPHLSKFLFWGMYCCCLALLNTWLKGKIAHLL